MPSLQFLIASFPELLISDLKIKSEHSSELSDEIDEFESFDSFKYCLFKLFNLDKLKFDNLLVLLEISLISESERDLGLLSFFSFYNFCEIFS